MHGLSDGSYVQMYRVLSENWRDSKGTTIVDEMEAIEKVFYSSFDAAQTYLDSNEEVSAGASSTEHHRLEDSEVNTIQKESYHLPFINRHRDQAFSNSF